MSIKVSPLLHKLLTAGKDSPLPAEYKIEPNKDGTINASKSGRYIHSKYNIEKECLSVLNANIDVESKKNIFAFYGFGLGHHVTHFAKEFAASLINVAKDDIRIVVLVTDVPLFIYAYFNMAMSYIAKYDTMFIHYNEDVLFALKDVDIENITGVNFIMLPSVEREYKDIAGSVHSAILETIERKFSDMLTRLHFQNLWTKNILKNTTNIADYPSASGFEGALKGFNALIVAAGPTLNIHIEAIKQNREGLFIIAADTALGCLSTNGIVADVVITMDAGIYNVYDFIYNKLDFHYLFTDIISQPSVFKINKDKSNIVLFSSNENSSLIKHIEQKLGINIQRLNASFTVATAAIELANYLGVDNAVLIGFDNSFPNYERHAKHTLSFDYSLLRSNRLNTMDSMYFDTIRGQSDMETYPPTSYILESQIDYLARLQYDDMNIVRIRGGAIGIEAIDKNVAVEDYACDNAQAKALESMTRIYDSDQSRIKNSLGNAKIKEMYNDVRDVLTNLIKILHNSYNAIIGHNNMSDCEFYDNMLDQIINDIKQATDQVGFLRDILSHANIVIARSGADSYQKSLLLTTEAIKSITYFNTRVEQILLNYAD